MTILEERPAAAQAAGSPPAAGTTGGPPYPNEPLDASRSFWQITHRYATESRVVVAAAFVVYLIVAILLDFKFLVFPPDAMSRMANGFYVLYSRDPHLAAIGFVWNPLTSILDMGPLLFKDLWPALATHDIAGSLVSVCCMTGAVHQLRSALNEAGVRRAPRLVLTALFAFNPMILYYAGNGMSEALYLFTAVAVCRYLQRWFRGGDVRSLVYAATALGLCYLARNEASAIAITSGALVLWRTFARTEGQKRHRVMAALTDGAIYLLPVITTFAGWAVAGGIITGQPFGQFTSQYGNSNQISAYGAAYGPAPGQYMARILHEATDLTYLAPLLPLAITLAIVGAAKFRDWQCLVPIAVLGGGIGFIMVSYLDNQVFPWLRFYILVIPLEVLAVGAIMSVGSNSRVAVSAASTLTEAPPSRARKALRFPAIDLAALGGVVTALVMVGPSVLTGGLGMFNPKVGIEESTSLGFLVHAAGAETTAQRWGQIPMLSYLDGLNLPNGDVVVDNTLICPIEMIVRSTNPKMFVIPNDVAFQRTLADPLVFHAHYILVPKQEPGQYGIDVSEQYPTMYENGAGFAHLVKSFPQTALCPPYRLYHVTELPPAARGY